MAHPISAITTSMIVNRASGLVTSPASVLSTLKVVSALKARYSGKSKERLLAGGTIVGLAVDILICVSVILWLLNVNWSGWGYAITIISGLERLRSIHIVHLCFLRTTAIVLPLQRFKPFICYITAIYTILAIITFSLEVYIHSDYKWDATRFSSHPAYTGKCTSRVLCVLFYVIPAICTDFYLLFSKRVKMLVGQRLTKLRTFYDPRIYIVEETLVAFSVVIPLIIGLVDHANEWSAPTLNEHFLLSLILLNSTLSIKAILGEGGIFSSDFSERTASQSHKSNHGYSNTLSTQKTVGQN